MEEALSENIESIPSFESGRHRLIIGVNGSGKTQRLNAIRKKRKEEGRVIIWLDYAHLVHEFEINNISYDKNKDPSEVSTHVHDVREIEDYLSQVNGFKQKFIDVFFRGHDIDLVEGMNKFTEPLLNLKFDSSNMQIMELHRKMIYSNVDDATQRFEKMSPGEHSLLCTALYLSVLSGVKPKNNMVFLIDEPESHMHPDALVKFMEILGRAFDESEIWIASHSIHLVSIFPSKDIDYMDEGRRISKDSCGLDRLYEKMLGSHEVLEDALSDAYSRGFEQYIRECFREPGYSSKITGNTQFDSLLESLKGKSYTILDFGAGGTKLFGHIFDTVSAEYKIEYHTYFGPTVELDEQPRCYKEHYEKPEEIPKIFDVVLLVNTLHEINPAEWVRNLNIIRNSLKEDGCIFFSECLHLKYGENPGTGCGYIILRKNEIEQMFDVNAVVYSESGNTHPSHAHVYAVIPKNKIILTDEKVRVALSTLEAESRDKYWEELNKSGRSSRLCAFYAIQSLNANEALKIFDKR